MDYLKWTKKLVQDLPGILPHTEPQSAQHYRNALNNPQSILRVVVEAAAKVADKYTFEQELRYSNKVEEIEKGKSALRTEVTTLRCALDEMRKAATLLSRTLEATVKDFKLDQKLMEALVKKVAAEVKAEDEKKDAEKVTSDTDAPASTERSPFAQ